MAEHRTCNAKVVGSILTGGFCGLFLRLTAQATRYDVKVHVHHPCSNQRAEKRVLESSREAEVRERRRRQIAPGIRPRVDARAPQLTQTGAGLALGNRDPR